MKKDAQFTFRIPSELKGRLEEIASREGRSVAQICEAFLTAGTELYKKRGGDFFRRFLVPRKRVSTE